MARLSDLVFQISCVTLMAMTKCLHSQRQILCATRRTWWPVGRPTSLLDVADVETSLCWCPESDPGVQCSLLGGSFARPRTHTHTHTHWHVLSGARAHTHTHTHTHSDLTMERWHPRKYVCLQAMNSAKNSLAEKLLALYIEDWRSTQAQSKSRWGQPGERQLRIGSSHIHKWISLLQSYALNFPWHYRHPP